MKLTAKDLYDLKVIDKIVKEPEIETEESFLNIVKNLKKEMKIFVSEFQKKDANFIVEQRYEKFRNMGEIIAL